MAGGALLKAVRCSRFVLFTLRHGKDAKYVRKIKDKEAVSLLAASDCILSLQNRSESVEWVQEAQIRVKPTPQRFALEPCRC